METVEAWAQRFIETTSLAEKLDPGTPPSTFASGPALRIDAPGRPPELAPRTEKRKRPRDLTVPIKRAEVIHTFFHHELQAAELMAWAILTFPDSPLSFRKGLLGICRDELRHLNLYAVHLEALGHPVGSFPVNDWFWSRVPCDSPVEFVARMAIGFEGGNLDHGVRFTEVFAEAGDARAAEIQALITREEIAHAAFGIHWFRELTGGLDFETWSAMLPKPITPLLTRGHVLNVEARRAAGFPEAFIEALEKYGRPSP